MTCSINVRRFLAITFGLSACMLAAFAIYLCFRSVLIAIDLNRPLIWYDEWEFVRDYFKYLDGGYSLSDLFAQHAEDRMLLTRAVLFWDAINFDLTGRMPIVVMYVTQALTTLLIVNLATADESWPAGPIWKIIAFVTVLGLTWSISQFETFSFSFSLQVPFVNFFVFTCYMALAFALTGVGKQRAYWLMLACGADCLAVYSFGSGTFTLVPAIAMAVWLRRTDCMLLTFLGFHAVLLVLYFSNYRYVHPPPANTTGLSTYADFIIRFLGSMFRGWEPKYGIFVGSSGIITFLVAATFFTWTSLVKKRAVDRVACIFLTFAAFVFVEAPVAAYARSSYGVAPRYATASIFFLLALLAFAWRTIAMVKRPKPVARFALLGIAAFFLAGANAGHYELEWKAFAANLDRAGFAFVNGVFPEQEMKKVHPNLKLSEMERLADLRMGQFAPSAHAYQPPLNTLVGLRLDTLPPCRHEIDSVTSAGPGWWEVKAWAAHPTLPLPIDWIFAFDQRGQLVGVTRSLDARPEIATRLSIGTAYVGFNLYLNGNSSERPTAIWLVSTVKLPQASDAPRACTISFTLNALG